MSVRYSSTCRILLYICLFIIAGGYYLLPVDLIGEYVIRIIVVAIGCSLAFFCRVCTPRLLRSRLRKVDRIALLILLFSGLEVLISKKRFGYSLKDSIINYTAYLYVVFAYPFVYLCLIDKSIKGVLKHLSIIELIMLIVRFISFASYNYLGLLIFPRLLFQYNAWMRDGYQRIESSVFFGIALVFWTLMALECKKHKKIFCWGIVFFMLLFLAVASRVRFQFAVSVFVIVSIVFLINPKFTKRVFIKKLIIILAILYLLFAAGLFDTLLDYVSSSGRFGEQTEVRLNGINHYLSMLKGDRLLFGIGILDSNYPNVKSLMMRDLWSIYYLDDIGIIGGLAQFGLLSVFLYIPLFILGIRTCFKTRSSNNRFNYGLALGVSIYMIVSCAMLNIYDKQRAFDVPMYLGVLTYIFYFNDNCKECDIQHSHGL